MRAARTWDAAVTGGTVRVTEWGGAPPSQTPVNGGSQTPVLAIHGITANHRTWEPLVALLPGRRVLATDLRGRGGSAALPAPFGMEQHALDLLAVLDAAGVERAVVVGHSMGASVAVTLHHLAPDRAEALLLVDGGLPLYRPPGITGEQAVQLLLGPALDRLSMTFPDRQAYRRFWQAHPSFQDWSEATERYVDYDLVETSGGFRSCVQRKAVVDDFVDQMDGSVFLAALRTLEQVPFDFLRAPRGLLDQSPGPYPPQLMAQHEGRYPDMRWREVDDVNHYMVLLADRGARAVAEAIAELRPL